MTHHTTTYNNSSNSFLHLWKVRMTFLFLIMTVMGVGSAWAQTVSKWDGTKPTETWSAANVTAAGITGSGTEANPYVIHDATGFVYFWWAANNGNLSSSTQYWKLDADIDLDNHTWPHVNLNKTFKGKFDGQNHTISNMKLEPATANYNYGLFCVIQGANATNHAEVKNLTISNSTIAPSADFTKTTSIGILAGKADGNVDISNITISGTNSITYSKKINDENYIGGLLGQITGANTSVTNCHVSSLTMTAKSTTTNAYFAGLIGRINVQGTVTNCSTTDVTINYELIANASRLAGLVGNSKGTKTGTPTVITDCATTRTKINLPEGINNGCYIGAFIGQVSNDQQEITNNTVDSPEITIETDIKAASYIGGAIGDFSGSSADYMGSLTGLTVTSPSVTVDKVSIKDCCIGATFGRISTYSAVKSVAVSNPTLTYKATDNPNYSLSLGSFAGYITGNATQEVAVTDIDITGDAQVVLGTGSSNLSNIRAGLVGYANANVRLEDWTVENTEVQVKGNLTTATSYLGGVVGYSYTNATNTPVTIKDVQVEDCDISLDGNISIATYVGGIVGWLKAYATTSENANSIQQCSISGKIRSTGSHTFTENITYAFGGIVGYTDQSATAISVIEQCTSNVDFNLSGFTPVKVSGSNYNLYRSGFVVGGVIGRINTPSRLPEHLYYSGKIYAPFAAVGPAVGVFNTNLNAAAYVYDDYVGTNATNVTAEEWKKADSWYYNDYKLGLSSDVISQTARTKNYKTSPAVEDGVNYLTVDDKTFSQPNEISGAVKNSYTVLAYTANNTDKDMGIFPQWNTNSATYPAYYMYYMQGLNRGKYVSNDEVDFVKILMASNITFNPTLTRTGDDEHGYVFTVDPGDAEVTDGFTLTYQWYQSDKTTPMPGETGKALSISKDDLEAVGNTVFCVVTVSGTGFTSVSRTLRGMYAIVVFVNGNNYAGHGAKPGIDTNDGMTPQTPVKTIDKANSLLDGGPWDKNIIVVMGLLNPGTDQAFRSKGTNPATLTGKWDGVNYEGQIRLFKTSETGANNTQSGSNGFHNYVKGDTKFEYLTIRANKNSDDNNFFDCHGNDVWFGKGLVMTNFRNLGKNHGNLEEAQKVPELTVLMTATNLSEADIQTYTNRNKPQTLTIESGHYGRILAGRFTQAFFTNGGNTSHTILGSVAHPMWAVINVDIDKDNQMTDGGSTTYTCDINCIVAGLTDGSMYGDYEINVRGGKVEYVVGGNQGNPAANGSKTYTQPGGKSGNWGQWPNASFYGRSVINVEQDTSLKDITIGNLYAGGLGRDLQSSGSATVVDMYMYGQTEINMKSGTVTGNVYGGGAGGVIGLSPWDMHMPYATTAADDATNAIMNKVQYGTWGSMPAGSPLASVALHNSDGNGGYTTTELDLSKSSTTLNISGGTINGSVYGGGGGFVNNMPDKVAMQGVGSVFGTSNVNVSGGTIHGSVYGGSEGDPGYYGKTNNYGQTIKHIAEMNGTVNINITGASTHIGGNIYGAGQGIASTSTQEYTDIATAGNAELGEEYKTNINILIDLPDSNPFTGNIYGGGQMGAVDGNTNVIIKGGKITGNVFAGGLGEDGHADKAKVTGNTLANIQGGTQGDEYAVYGGAQMALVDGNTAVILQGGTVGNAYGGGLGTNTMAANVTGDATVQLGSDDGKTSSKVLGSIFGANNLNGTPKGHVKVHVLKTTPRDGQGADGYDVAAVYGGGNLAAYEPTNANEFAEVLIENCDNSIEYVYGGGNAAPVPATQVTIKGANAIDNAFAGGNGAGADNPGADIGYKGFFSKGAATEYGTGIATINVQGGTIHHVYGGSNTLGYIKDHAVVNVNAAGTCPMDVAELYGGGKMAPGKAAQINITCTGEGKIDNVYGGAHMADLTGDIELNIRGGNIGNAFGGNNESGTIDGTITVNVDWTTGPEACGKNSLTNVYGGGNLAPYTTPDGKVGPTVNLKNGTVSNNVYGGGYGEAAVVTGNPIVNLIGGTVTNDIFGGGDAAPVTGDPLINANYGTVKDIFAGGRGSTAVVTGSPKAYINKTDDKELTVVDVYGGGDAANVIGTANVQVDKGTVKDVYGGGNAADVTNTEVIINGGNTQMAFGGGHGDKTAEPQKEANVSGDASLTIHGGTVAQAFAGSNSKGTITGSQLVTIVKDANSLAELHVTEVYGGGNQADGKAGTFDIGCTGSDSEGIGDLFGGAREANITGDVAFTIEGGKIDRIFGGNNVSGNVAGSIQVNIAEDKEKYDCGLHVGYVYGGGQDAAYTPTTPGAYPEVNIIGGNIAHDVFGGGLGATAIVTSNPVVNIQGGTIGDNVFGGGSLAETEGNPTVNVSGGTVTHDVYGGGALADVTGNTTVNLTGGAVGGAYGGALGSAEVAAKVNGDTYVHLDGSKVTETGIFGANNLNGTPTGHVKVHVTSTTPRDGQNAKEYDVPAVYGGGNLSAYEPSDETFAAGKGFAEVLIENCGNSIDYVYGGGNAAPVPATSVTIYGANAINNAFAGGNGAGTDNPGADVGYKGYYSKGSREEYGTGETDIKIYGGIINNVYGGSNTLGYIREHAYVEVLNVPEDYKGTICELHLGEVHAGGNEAEMYCGGSVTLACSEGAEVVYAGSSDADIHGDIDLVITSGTYGKVFGGNNHSGNVYGGITINIDETGCWPVMIGELYACGNEAPYSVYGYNNDKSCKTSGDILYKAPEINLISFTRIGKVFGGGYAAEVYGSPTINVEPITGKFANWKDSENNDCDWHGTPNYILDESDLRVPNTSEMTITYGQVGSIGTIYGGGNKGAVYGNTEVKIGTLEKNKHYKDKDNESVEPEEVAVTITGNIFGGGNEAIVSGDTNVKIGENN